MTPGPEPCRNHRCFAFSTCASAGKAFAARAHRHALPAAPTLASAAHACFFAACGIQQSRPSDDPEPPDEAGTTCGTPCTGVSVYFAGFSFTQLPKSSARRKNLREIGYTSTKAAASDPLLAVDPRRLHRTSGSTDRRLVDPIFVAAKVLLSHSLPVLIDGMQSASPR